MKFDALLPPEITERAGIGGGREDEDAED